MDTNLQLKAPFELSSYNRNASTAVSRVDSVAGDFRNQTEEFAANRALNAQEFSIDELREIAHHFGVPHLAQMTERGALVAEIRRRI